MNILNITNLQYTELVTAINCMVETAEYGMLPFTASSTDTEQHGADIYNTIVAGTYGPIAPYIAPPVAVVPITAISAAQARVALNTMGLRDMVETFVLGSTQNVMDYWEYETIIKRDSIMLNELALAAGITQAQLDELFILGATL